MKKIISWLTVFSLFGSISVTTISCSCAGWDSYPPVDPKYDACYDEWGNNVTVKGSDINQWLDMSWIELCFYFLSKEKFPDEPNIFFQLNGQLSQKLNKFFSYPDGRDIPDDEHNFQNDFTFLITNYESLNSQVIEEMKENELADKESGTYLFLNLPLIDIHQINQAPKIDFQYLFIIKEADGTIIGNHNNRWFYWYDCQTVNDYQPKSKYFFNLMVFQTIRQNRVVTKPLQ